jgi:hypothetical protein
MPPTPRTTETTLSSAGVRFMTVNVLSGDRQRLLCKQRAAYAGSDLRHLVFDAFQFFSLPVALNGALNSRQKRRVVTSSPAPFQGLAPPG